MNNSYKVLNLDNYYRKGVYRHFTEDCKCSVSITHKIDVAVLRDFSVRTKTKFNINFLWCLAKAVNSREDYRMAYLWQKNQVVVFDTMNVTHYVFRPETETCTPVYTEFDEDYATFYARCAADIESAKASTEYLLDEASHQNYFDASFISWISYEALNVELPDGYLYYQPIINYGKYTMENGKLVMPVTVRLNHAIADGYLVSKLFLLLEESIENLVHTVLTNA